LTPLVVGCGGSKPGGSTTQTAASEATVRTARCNLWNVLDSGDRQRLIAGLRAFFGGRVDAPGRRGQVLPDRYAYTFLTSYCRQPFARAFLLYRLYGNASAFTPSK
jgi:hypothetical protein